ncbi:hypothetical protein [Nocardioides sp.]|uniref:hypothetical protein n=1 Tax=Nocardioides sp. TaxID=35761 RepID=UPI002ED48825
MHPGRRLAVLVLAVAWLLAGCGAGPELSPPTGVDELQIPTESPDPRDFVGTVDNPWFPLEPGRTWEYDVSGEAAGRKVTVERGPEVIGVATTARVAEQDGTQTVDWYAQDEAGNVWWFGRQGEWQAGRDGAQAGLAMAAHPRVGDGYRTGFADGIVEERAQVLSLTETAQVEAGTFSELVVTEVSSPLEPGLVQQHYYASGVGLVMIETLSGGTERVELVSYTAT